MSSAVMWARDSGPLALNVVGYAAELTRQGYAERTVEDHLRLVAELERWMASEALLLVDLTPLLSQETGHDSSSVPPTRRIMGCGQCGDGFGAWAGVTLERAHAHVA
jgi:hypothetical protein